MASTSQVIPFAVPWQSPPNLEPISQTELALLLSLRGRLSQLETQVANAEESIKQRLQNGAGVEVGDHTATLQTSFRRNVSWKSVAERLADRRRLDGYIARVLAATRPTPTVSLDLR